MYFIDFVLHSVLCYLYNEICCHIQLNSKVKWSRYRHGVAQRVGRGVPLPLHDRGTRRGWVVSSTPQLHFTPRKDPVPIVQESGWAENLVPTAIWSRIIQPVVSHYTDWATQLNSKFIKRYAGCIRRNLLYFGRMFLKLNYISVTKHSWQWTVAEVMEVIFKEWDLLNMYWVPDTY